MTVSNAFNPELYMPRELSPEEASRQQIANQYYDALAYEEQSVTPRTGGYGLKVGKMLDVLDLAVVLPDATDFAEKLVTDDLSFSPQGQVEGFARLALFFGDVRYLAAGFDVAETLTNDARLVALSKLMKAGGRTDPLETKSRLDLLVHDNDPHKRFLEANIAVTADDTIILDGATKKAEAYNQLHQTIDLTSDTIRLGFVGLFISGTVSRCLASSRLILGCGTKEDS